MMRVILAGLALSVALLAPAAPSAAGELPAECRRFGAEAKPNDLQPRLARLCVRLTGAHDSAGGMDALEREAATRLGQYLAVIGELDIRRGAIGIDGRGGHGAATTDTTRYLIAHRIGLLDLADRLAPLDRRAVLR